MGVVKRILAGVLAAAAIAGLGYGSFKGEEALNPVSNGVTYLQNHGYTDVKGGNVNFFNSCGNGYLARQYTAVNKKSGQKVSETICLSPLWWTHKALIG